MSADVRESPEQAAVRLLQQALGATISFASPAPHEPGELLELPPAARLLAPAVTIETATAEQLVAAGCCGGFAGPDGEIEACYRACPMRGDPAPAARAYCCGHGSPGVGECRDCPAGPPAPRFLAPAPGEPCTTPGCGGACGFPESEHDAITFIAPTQELADAARAGYDRAVGGQQLEQVAGAAAAFLAPAPSGTGPRYNDDLWRELTDAVREYAANDPRSLQVEIGPSEIGHPCDARVLRTLLGVERTNLDADPWASFVGQAVHAKLADVFDWMNKRLGRERYFVERRVYASDGIFGSCDLFRDGLVIDHKIVGADSMKELKRLEWEAKGGVYSKQLDIYGLGWARAGLEVTEVALAAWPRSGFLDGLHTMRRPWDRAAAEAALDRLSRLTASAVEPGVDCDSDAFWETVPVAPSKQCGFCYWYAPTHDPDVPDRLHCGAARNVRKSAP